VNFVNPFAARVAWPRALTASVFGTLLPTLGLLTLASWSHPVSIPAPLPIAGLFALCGAAAGLAFPQRYFAWALLLSLVPATLIPPLFQALAVAWVLTVAHWGARWQNARRRLL
jgi:hypothetical protein